MRKQRYQNNTSLVRSDGQVAFSATGRAIADRRISARKGGRIKKILGNDSTFTDAFKNVFSIEDEYLWILERVHLEKEIEAVKKIIKALKRFPKDKEAKKLLKKIRSSPIERMRDCIHCPVWRHERELEITDAAVSRYVFPQVRDQLYLVTIVFDFAENLIQLEDMISEAHQTMNDAIKHMTSERRGVMITGCFEPDLQSKEELLAKPSRRKMLEYLSMLPPVTGGWTLTGHFFVRAANAQVLEEWFNTRLPTIKGWERVQFKPIKENESLMAHLVRVLGYAGKFPRPIFGIKTRGPARKQANKDIQKLSAAFNGPFMKTVDSTSFDVNAAIVQWTKFTDRMGAKKMYYSWESVYAQKWHSSSEMDYLRITNDDMKRRGEHRIETHRDCGHFSHRTVMPHLKGRLRPLRTRKLRYDHDWVMMTDCSGIDTNTHYHDFDHWMIKP